MDGVLLFPIPNQMEMWPNFRSPLLWDVFAVGTYATVSLLFWYVGMVPDLATFRDRAKGKFRQIAYGVFAWAGTARAGTGTATSGCISVGGPGHAARAFRALGREF